MMRIRWTATAEAAHRWCCWLRAVWKQKVCKKLQEIIKKRVEGLQKPSSEKRDVIAISFQWFICSRSWTYFYATSNCVYHMSQRYCQEQRYEKQITICVAEKQGTIIFCKCSDCSWLQISTLRRIKRTTRFLFFEDFIWKIMVGRKIKRQQHSLDQHKLMSKQWRAQARVIDRLPNG